MGSNSFHDELFKQKLAYPYEYFIFDNFDNPIDLTKEDFHSTLNQSRQPDEKISRTQETFKKYI